MAALGFLAPNLGQQHHPRACPCPASIPADLRWYPGKALVASASFRPGDGQLWSGWKHMAKKGQLLIHSSCGKVQADGRGTKVQNHITSCFPTLPTSLLQHPGEQPAATQPGEPASGQGTLRAALQYRIRHAQPYQLDQGTGFRGGDPSSPAQHLGVANKAAPSSSQAIISPPWYFHPHIRRL